MPYTVDAGGSVAPRRNKEKQKNSGIIKSVAERRTPLMDVIDSWEAGRQDWTDDFAVKLKARCGYDCIPYLPALTGRYVLRVGSAQSVVPVGSAFHRRPDADAVSITPLQMTYEEPKIRNRIFAIDGRIPVRTGWISS